MHRLLVIGVASALSVEVCARYAARGVRLHVVAKEPSILRELCLDHPDVVCACGPSDAPGLVARGALALGGVDGVLVFCTDVAVVTDTPLDVMRRQLLGPVGLLTEVADHFQTRRRGRLAVVNVIHRAHRGTALEPALEAATSGLDAYLRALRPLLEGVGTSLTLVTLGADAMPAAAADEVVRAIDEQVVHAYVPAHARALEWFLDRLPGWFSLSLSSSVRR